MQVGDIVLYNHGVHETVMVSDQPLAAIVTYVHAVAKEGHPVRVNLAVFGKNGDQWQKHSVPLWDGNDEPPEERLAFAYQVGSDPAARRVDMAALAYPENDSEPVDPPVDTKSPTYSITPVAPSAGLAGPDASPTSVQASEDPYASSVA